MIKDGIKLGVFGGLIAGAMMVTINTATWLWTEVLEDALDNTKSKVENFKKLRKANGN